MFRLNENKENYVSKNSGKTGFEEPSKTQRKSVKKNLAAGGFALIIDDEEVLRKNLESILASYGFTTLLANDGVEGIELYEKHQGEIEIVIIDINMPRFDGSKGFERRRKDG